VDFVLCDKNNIKPLLVIELDDSTHTNKHRQERDNFINDVLHDAGLPIFHQKVQNSYNLQETESEILKLL
jgi:very-short-patch-repair endonuclease